MSDENESEPPLILEVEVINPSDEETEEQNDLVLSQNAPSTSGQVINAEEEEQAEDHVVSPKLEDDEEDEEPDPKRSKLNETNEDDGRLCMICLDNWTNSGTHRICALRCGHLFGHNCILRWISSNKSCPTCKLKANKHDIRFIYANKLIAMDTSELDALKKQLEIAIEEKNRVQIDLTKAICHEHLLMREIDEYKEKIRILNTMNISTSQKSNVQSGNQLKLKSGESLFICGEGTCRVMDLHVRSQKFVVSLKSPNMLFQGFGVRQYNMNNFSLLDYTPLHTKPIRDVKYNPVNDTLLSVSLDKVVKVVDMRTCQQVSAYTGANMYWSCCWEANNTNYLYAGEQQGSILKFDIRNMAEPISIFKINGDMSPVVSLASLPASPDGPMALGGFIACKLNSIWAFENTPTDCSKYLIPVSGPFISMSYNNDVKQLLISVRPNSHVPNMRHIVNSLDKQIGDTVLKCNPVHTFCGGRLQKHLARSCFVQTYRTKSLQIAAQQDNSIVLWSVNSGKLSASVKAYSPVIDLMELNNTDGTHLLALSEKKLNIYKFSDE